MHDTGELQLNITDEEAPPLTEMELLSRRIQTAVAPSGNGHDASRNMTINPEPEIFGYEEITAEELKQLEVSDRAVTAPMPVLADFEAGNIRSLHHALARDVAGKKTVLEMSRTYGIHPNTVKMLMEAPAFQELVLEYSVAIEVGDPVGFDLKTKMMGLAHESVDQLRDHITVNGKEMSSKQLLDISTEFLDRTGHGKSSSVAIIGGLQSDELKRIKARPPEQGELEVIGHSSEADPKDQ